MKTFKVDLDYESYLFDPEYVEDSKSNQKMIREFEYIFFLINKEPCALKNAKGYQKTYLDHLKKLGFFIPQLTPDAERFEYWWGHRHDKELEKKLNSKLTSARIAKEHGWGFFEGAIVQNVEEMKEHLLKSKRPKWILKKPDSFSGQGHYQFTKENFDETKFQKILNGPCLLEPLYERLCDIGTTFIIENGKIERQFMILNFNSENGRFQGGAGANDNALFKKYFEEKYQYSLDALEKIARDIAEVYIQEGALSNVQIDSFIYKDQGDYHLYPLVEVNYRKTMGMVIQSLADHFRSTPVIEWRIVPTGTVKLPDDVILLSPADNHFQSYVSLGK